jgi:hypothetical protein
MTTHSSATERVETPHATHSTNKTISDAVRRRAQSLSNDRTIDGSARAFIRYALEIDDPYLPELVRRADAGESIFDNITALEEAADTDKDEEKIEALADIICRAGDEPEIKSAALLVLMATVENAPDGRALANTAKHLAFTRCGELNCYDMVDYQIARIEYELLASTIAD